MSLREGFKLRPLSSLAGYSFLVEKYQRGYKWDVLQVLQLMDDIYGHQRENGQYCLQPIVVKKLGANEYELIDGQQRLSTIFILLKVIGQAFYSITYRTRDASEAFLRDISHLPFHLAPIDRERNLRHFDEELNRIWESYAVENPTYDNIDNHHFFKAYQTVKNWVHEQPQAVLNLKENLEKATSIIWYEVLGEERPEKVFARLNSGKISLTGAELIKALFVLTLQKEPNLEVRGLKQNIFAREWDDIERSLQDDSFWYFIRGKDKAQYQTRIDLLFDIIHNKPPKTDSLYSYRKYDALFQSGEDLGWQKVKTLFEHFKEWFQNREQYHLIGFAVGAGFKSIREIVNLYEEKKEFGKSNFTRELQSIIKQRFAKKGTLDNGSTFRPYDLDNLDYTQDTGALKEVLLLFNIESYQLSDPGFRFPFDRYHKEDWSLEHIHAQHAKDISSVSEALDWLGDQKSRLALTGIEPAGDNQALQQRLLSSVNELMAELTGKEELSKDNKNKLGALAGQLESLFEVHSISNMALLDRNTNSAIGNGKFLSKRKEILEIDRTGFAERNGEKVEAFIPLCTKNAFLKYYSKREDTIQMTCWSSMDASDYYDAIAATLKKYYEPSTGN